MLGTRLKYFRNRCGLSQLEAEVLTGLSAGVISRIENNIINPTKESVLKIAEVFKLNEEEIDYLIGKTQNPASKEEIILAKNSIQDLINSNNRLLYLLDDRKRLIAVSNGFRKLIPVDWDKYIDQSVINLIVDQASNPIFKIFRLQEIVANQLKLYYAEMGYQEDDQIYQDSIIKIKSNSITSKLWDKITTQKQSFNVYDQNFRQVALNIYGYKIELKFSREKLLNSRRFEIVEYNTDSKILKKILKLA